MTGQWLDEHGKLSIMSMIKVGRENKSLYGTERTSFVKSMRSTTGELQVL